MESLKPTVHIPMELHPMDELMDDIQDKDIIIFDLCFHEGKSSIARQVITDRYKSSACGWCYTGEYK